jgi:hypothetical protein
MGKNDDKGAFKLIYTIKRADERSYSEFLY